MIDPGELLDFSAGTMLIVLSITLQPAIANPIVLPQDFLEYVTKIPLLSNHTTGNNTGTTPVPEESDSGSAMSIMWYLVSFGGLVTFFLLLSFSEFCCKKTPRVPSAEVSSDANEPPAPPPYELFAPPAYESLFRSISRDRKRSIRASVFLIPVHDKAELPKESALEFGEVIRRNPMGDGEVVTPPPPP